MIVITKVENSKTSSEDRAVTDIFIVDFACSNESNAQNGKSNF